MGGRMNVQTDGIIKGSKMLRSDVPDLRKMFGTSLW